VADPAGVDGFLDRPEASFERRLGIGPMEVIEVDRFGFEAAQALLDLLADRLRPA
jgi:hypothetical protein